MGQLIREQKKTENWMKEQRNFELQGSELT